jgi:hypothetical protein
MTWKEKKLSEFVVAVLAFLSMMGAALLGLLSKTRLPSEHLQDDTRSVANYRTHHSSMQLRCLGSKMRTFAALMFFPPSAPTTLAGVIIEPPGP